MAYKAARERVSGKVLTHQLYGSKLYSIRRKYISDTPILNNNQITQTLAFQNFAVIERQDPSLNKR
jgi:hypothetical protein